jgi:protein-disulfide isomerase
MKKAASVETPKKSVKRTVSAKVETSKKETPDKSYLEIRLPKFSFRNTSLNAYLVFALVIFAFLLGMLTNKVIYLEKIATAPTPTSAPVAADPQPEPPAVVKVDNGHLPVLGDEKAKVSVVEFSDFQCPFCKRYYDDTHKQLDEQYIKTGKIKFYYRHYPLYSIHPNAERGALASECANDQGKFWEYYDALFANQVTWSGMDTPEKAVDSLVDLAGQLSMDTDAFRTCLETQQDKKNVDNDAAAGNKVQVDGTPTFFINGHRLVGAQPFSEFQKLIDAELKK